jgi:hypothetical protein
MRTETIGIVTPGGDFGVVMTLGAREKSASLETYFLWRSRAISQIAVFNALAFAIIHAL